MSGFAAGELREMCRAITDSVTGTIGYCIRIPEWEITVESNAQAAVNAASLIKLPIMAEAFRQIECGEMDPTVQIEIDPELRMPSCGILSYMHPGYRAQIRDIITLMIIVSDNTAANILIDLLGMDRINRMIRCIGMTETVLNRKLFDTEAASKGSRNTISARDAALFFQKLAAKQLVSDQSDSEMLKILENQQLNGKIPFYLEEMNIGTAHKTGEDDRITHDAGLIYTSPLAILSFVSENTEVQTAELAIRKLAKLTADFIGQQKISLQ